MCKKHSLCLMVPTSDLYISLNAEWGNWKCIKLMPRHAVRAAINFEPNLQSIASSTININYMILLVWQSKRYWCYTKCPTKARRLYSCITNRTTSYLLVLRSTNGMPIEHGRAVVLGAILHDCQVKTSEHKRYVQDIIW